MSQRSALVCLAVALAAGMLPPSAPAQVSRGPALNAVYLGWRIPMNMSAPTEDYITFYPDGRVYHEDPDEGMAAPLDWSTACRNVQCGTYRIEGSRVRIRWSSGSEDAFELEPGAVLRRPGREQRYRPLAPLDGVGLDGVYVLRGERGEVTVGITFSAAGEFREYNLMPYTNWVMRGDAAQRRRMERREGWGRYTIRRNTLELRYDGGPVARFMVSVPPGVAPGPRPATLVINRVRLLRVE